jgi:hypothetical protein
MSSDRTIKQKSKKTTAATQKPNPSPLKPAAQTSGLQQSVADTAQLSADDIADLQQTYGNGFVQRLAQNGRSAPKAQRQEDDLEARIETSRGQGQTLPDNLQQQMGQKMGADFKQVRVHTGSEANQLSQSLNAKAFTTGSDIYFKQGTYDPNSQAGQKLIAHELTHVVQQGGTSRQPIQKKVDVNEPDDRFEKEAEKMAETAVSTQPPTTTPPDSPANNDEPAPTDNSLAQETKEAHTAVQEGKASQEVVDQAKQEKSAEVNAVAAQASTAKPATDKAEGEEQAQEGEKTEKEGEQADEKKKGEKQAKAKTAKANLPDTATIDSLKYDPDAIEEPEMAEPLPTWNQLAYGTIQLQADLTEAEIAWRNSMLGGDITADTEEDQDNTADFKAMLEGQFQSEAGLQDTGDGELLDRDAMLRDALVGGVTAGVVQGATDWVADELVETATQKIPYADGWINIVNIAADPAGWAADVEQKFSADAAAKAFGGWGDIKNEKTPAGKAAFVFEKLLGIINWAEGILGFFNQILQIAIALLYVGWTIANAIPGGQAVAAAIMTVIKFLETINKFISAIVDFLSMFKPPLQLLAIICRAVDLKEIEGNPEEIRDRQAKLKGHVQAFSTGLTQRGLKAAKGAIKEKYAKHKLDKEKQAMRDEIANAPDVADPTNNIKSKDDLRTEFEDKYHESYRTEADYVNALGNSAQAKQAADRVVVERQQQQARDKYQAIKNDPEASYAAKREAEKSYQDSQARYQDFINPQQSKASKGAQIALGVAFGWNKDKLYKNFVDVGTSAKDMAAMASYTKNSRETTRQRDEATTNIENTNQQITDLTQQRSTNDEAMRDRNQEIDTLSRQQTTLRQEVVTKQSERKDLDTTISETKTQNQIQQKKFDAEAKTIENEIDKAKLSQEESDTRLKLAEQRYKTDISQADGDIKAQENKVKRLEEQIRKSKESEGEKGVQDTSNAEASLKKAQQQLEETKKAAMVQKAEADKTLQRAKKEEQVKRQEAEKAEVARRKELAEVKQQQTQYTQEYEQKQQKLIRDMEDIDRQIKTAQAQRRDNKGNIKEMRQTNHELYQTQQQLQQDMRNLENSLPDLQARQQRLQQLAATESAWQPSWKDVWSGGDPTVKLGHTSDRWGAGGQRHGPGIIGASGSLTDFIAKPAFGEGGLGQQFGNRLAAAMMPGLGGVAAWAKAYGKKDKLVVYKVDYQGGLPDTTADSVTEVTAAGGSTDEALKVVRQTDEEQVAEFVEGIDWAAKAPDHIKQNLAKDDADVSSARKKEIYNQQAGDYLKQYAQTDAVTTAHTIAVDKDNSPADQEFVVAKGAAPFSDLALEADPLSLKIKAEEGNQTNTYQFEPAVVPVESEVSDGVEVRSYALHYQGDERYQQDLAGGKAPAGQQMAKVDIASQVKQAPAQTSVIEQDLSKLSKADYEVNVKPAAAGMDPIPVAQPAKSLHLLAPQSDDGKNYKRPSIEIDKVNTTFAGEVSKEGGDPQQRSDLQGHLRPVDPADQKAKDEVKIDTKEERVGNETTPAYQQPIAYQPAVNSLADDEQLAGPLTIQRQPEDNRSDLTGLLPEAGNDIDSQKSVRSLEGVNADDDMIIIQRQPDDEETAVSDTPPPPQFDADKSLDDIRAEKQMQMIQELPEPPAEAMQQVDASAQAYNAVRTEEYILKLQQQEIAAERQDAQSQQMEAEAAEQAALTNQEAVRQHQQEVAQKAQSQKEMEQAANEAQKPAGQAFSISGEISKLLQGILTPMIGALGVADKEAGSGNQSGQANEVAKVGGQSHDTMGEGVQVAQSSGARAQQWQSETAVIQADATNQNRALADLGQEAGSQKEEAAEGSDYLSEAQAHIQEQLDELDAEKDEQIFQHEEGALEAEFWAEEHQEMRLTLFDQLETELEAEEEKRL